MMKKKIIGWHRFVKKIHLQVGLGIVGLVRRISMETEDGRGGSQMSEVRQSLTQTGTRVNLMAESMRDVLKLHLV